MKRFTTLLIAALASLGLMAGGALAQKAETPKDAPKKTEAPKDTKAKAEPKAEAKKAEPKAEAKKADAKKADAKKADSAAGGLIDINTASEKELASLPGIGEARAKAIVKNRPYKGKDDLKNRKIIPDSAYAQIQDKVIAKQK